MMSADNYLSADQGSSVQFKKLIACKKFLLIVYACLFFVDFSIAQNLINTGQINNSGTFRVKQHAIGLPDSIDGVFDFFGADQVIPARQYRHLRATGTGTKNSQGGNFVVSGDVTIGQAVAFKIEAGFILQLRGSLSEQGYLSGSIGKNVDLSGATTFSDFGNIGAAISWSGTVPGSTITTRTSGVSQTGNGYESVKRYYDIFPTTNNGLSASLILQYSDQELNGHDPTKLLLWKSIDGGQTWIVQGGTIDISSRTMTKHGITSFGRWTFADSLHPLGSLRPIGILAIVSGSNQSQPINSTLQPFDVVVTDSEGTLLEGETVVFSIVGFPQGAVGQVLSQTVIRTGSNGIASTTLKLGNKIGLYTVAAEITGGNNNPVIFTSTAYADVAAYLYQTAGSNQTQDIGTMLANPFTVNVTDSGGNAVAGVNLLFTISGTPTNAVGHALSHTSVITDSLGQASSILKLGSKIGRYTVAATIQGLSIDAVSFNATATAFLADANDDGSANIGDLTTVIDQILERLDLSDENFTRADVDTNNTIDARDEVIILGGLLEGRWDSIAVSKNRIQSLSDSYKGEFEITPQGLRFNLNNKTEVKGIQIALRMRNRINVPNPDLIFNRGKHMQIPLQREDDILRIVVYNNDNATVNAGSGSIFRLPLAHLKLDDFEIVYVIVSTPTNEGIQIPAQKVVAPSGKYPETFALDQNFPNPFNGDTKIRIQVPDGAGTNHTILLEVFDLSGRKVRTILNGELEPGTYIYNWDGTNDAGKQVSSGSYIYRMQTKDAALVKRMMFIK
ncbi:MAG: hypothetical protein C0417_08825 [Chlorobiaceae bacterium]|nr:hypothetical protein [Chlorobiaceae bacterium]